MSRLLGKLRKRISFSLILYLALIYLIMYSVLLGLELVVRGTSSEVLNLMILLGVMAGWLLGRSELKLWAASVISLVSGFIITVIHIGGIDVALWDLTRSGLINLWRWVFQGIAFDTLQLDFLLSVILSRLEDAIFNINLWFYDLLTGFSVYNQISTLISWGLILWTLAVWISWITRKKDQPIWGVIPAGALLAVLMTYTLDKRILLVILLGAGLTLIGMINHDTKYREWSRRRIKGYDNIRERMILVIVAFSAYTMVLAGLMPSIRIRSIADPIERLMYGDSEPGENSEETSLEGEGAYNSSLYSVERFAGLPRKKLIGSGPELAKRVVMIVKYPTTAFVSSGLPTAARYWRSFAYDQYTGVGWQTSRTQEVDYKPGQEIIEIQTDRFEIITQEIRLSNTLRGTLYSAGPPITVDQDVLVSWRVIMEENAFGSIQPKAVDDLFAVTLDPIIYQVRSLVPALNDEDLRSTGGEIPDWIRTRYLDLPDTVPDRVRDLAFEIVANQPTPYDQAKALETFLRSYPYSLVLPEPPLDRDVADYFLFDLQTGYCDYYATSMVVLARSVGLPSRVVVGYVGGQFDEENDQYLVTEADAHTWVEVYLSGNGWIPFEPTAARRLIDEEELILPLPPELEQLPQAAEVEESKNFPGWEVSLGVFVSIVVGIWISNRSDWSRLEQMDATTLSLVLYERLYRYSRWIGIGHTRADTIYEFERKIIDRLRNLIDSPRKKERLGGSAFEVRKLTENAIYANYRAIPVDPGAEEKMLEIWKDLRRRLRYAVWLSVLRTARERIFSLGSRLQNDDLLNNGASDGTS